MRSLPSLCLMLLIASQTRLANAQDFGKQSPGPLTEAHSSIDGQGNCIDCHVSGGELANSKCLGCHQDQRRKIQSGKGLHSSSKVAGQKCWTCHLEHRGRKHDIMGWPTIGGRENFDHRLTTFPLRGKHSRTKCNDCHKRKSKFGLRLYLGEKRACEACHRKDQPHEFDKGSFLKCEKCHSEVSWKPASMDRFNHNKSTDFKIEGVHKEVPCSKCHPREVFNLKKKKFGCESCHKSPHDGHLFGKKPCVWCHSPKNRSMSKFKFAHGRRTNFALQGKHKRIKCASCHRPKTTRKPDPSCGGCHAKDSKHGDRFNAFGDPPQCETCHAGSTRWKPATFDHRRKTEFPLTGKHARVGCRKCHRGKRPDKFEKFSAKKVGCRGCHQHRKVHDGKFPDSRCLKCHKMAGVITPTAEARNQFHGPKSRFPLANAHKRVECEACHRKNQWKGVDRQCGPKCHQDSLHRGSLGKECASCHDGGIWDAKRFDHNRQSEFKLRGFHVEAKCQDCHPKQQYKPRPTECFGCHGSDDAHRGKLGKKCQRCHVETGALTFDHNSMASFDLDGKHLRVACADCHPSIEFKPRPKKCEGCHPEPEVHRGRYGTDCAACHTTKTWESMGAVHDVGSFALEGAHDAIACVRCHKGGQKLSGTGNKCRTCHREDDIHSGSLGVMCGDCHTQWSFAPARFDHVTVGCDLQGLHRTLPCYDCHKSGNFGALSTHCYGCHRDDAVNQEAHRGAGFFDCGTCHNINFWERPNTAPAMTSSVCR